MGFCGVEYIYIFYMHAWTFIFWFLRYFQIHSKLHVHTHRHICTHASMHAHMHTHTHTHNHISVAQKGDGSMLTVVFHLRSGSALTTWSSWQQSDRSTAGGTGTKVSWVMVILKVVPAHALWRLSRASPSQCRSRSCFLWSGHNVGQGQVFC